ncbi:hypothetical protein ACEQ8H_005572 [Pleosporales sp. CAS-2024a]
MLKVAVASLASAWLVSAQRSDNNGYHTHAAFALIRTGERTPMLRQGAPVLTALGAQQMFKLGQNLRTRYIAGATPSGLGIEHIAGMSNAALDNNQIMIQTSSQQHVISSAQAFMQGLYPPHSLGNSNGTAFSLANLLSNGSAIDFPLGGYQYANIQSAGPYDPDSIFVSGIQNCPEAQQAAVKYFTTPSFYNTSRANEELYNKLNIDWFEGNLMPDQLSYVNAIAINDYIQYQYNHNRSIYRTLTNDSTYDGVYQQVQSLADEEAWYLYGNTSASATDADDQAIGGKMLAADILSAFQMLVADIFSPGDKTDMSYPLNFLFSEPESFISLISLIMADYRNEYFHSIPPFGSVMIFELFSTGANGTFPVSDDSLWVRFYFHNGTDSGDEQLTAFPIFGNGPSRTDMMWSDFQNLFSRIEVNSLQTWCNTCNSSALFCLGADNLGISPLRSSQVEKHNAVSPAVGGVIGAIITLAVAGLLLGLAMLFGGVRFHRVQQRSSKKSELGGFKGSAKLASDPDLSLAKNGVPPAAGISFVPDKKRGHERVGSWELRQKEFGADERDNRDAIDAMATAKPVQVEERV